MIKSAYKGLHNIFYLHGLSIQCFFFCIKSDNDVYFNTLLVIPRKRIPEFSDKYFVHLNRFIKVA